MPLVHRPAAIYIMEAQTIARQMEAQGILLTQEQAQALAHAKLGPPVRWEDEETRLSPEQLQAMRRVRDEYSLLPPALAARLNRSQDQDQRPSVTGNPIAEDPAAGNSSALDQGQGDHYSDEQQQNRWPK